MVFGTRKSNYLHARDKNCQWQFISNFFKTSKMALFILCMKFDFFCATWLHLKWYEMSQAQSKCSAAASGWVLAHLEFGSSVNPITTRGEDYAHHITASPPGFENLAASLKIQIFLEIVAER